MTRLANAQAFFGHLRDSDVLGPVLTQGEVNGTNAVLAACGAAGWSVAWTAYGLATPFHETAGSMLPVVERGGAEYFRRKYDVGGLNPALARQLGNLSPGDGALYCGRGLVQLTGRGNYHKAEDALGVALVASPELACRPDVASRILVWGMEGGKFTGVGLDRFLPRGLGATRQQFTAARRIINGVDDAALIAGYAETFQTALTLGGWA